MDTKFCPYCLEYFKPDARVGDRQKCCGKSACKRQRKRDSQKQWVRNNPDYFKGRYQNYLKDWLKEHPGYLKDYRQRKSLQQNLAYDIQDELTNEITKHYLSWRHDIQDELTRIFSRVERFSPNIQVILNDIQDKIMSFTARNHRVFAK